MNASRDPWTDEEIRAGIREASETGPEGSELLVYLISMGQRTMLALEKIADIVHAESLNEEAARTDGSAQQGDH
jgi:hypothetical protein